MLSEEEGDQKPLRPGENYAIYNSRDVLGTMPEEVEQVIEHGAKWAKVETEYVCGVAEKYERRLLRWWKREKRGIREGRMRGGDKDDGLYEGDTDTTDDAIEK